ncbi:MAG: hypothetical protein ACRELA_13300 [Candidatus Rokuibacteriota bacterium]
MRRQHGLIAGAMRGRRLAEARWVGSSRRLACVLVVALLLFAAPGCAPESETQSPTGSPNVPSPTLRPAPPPPSPPPLLTGETRYLVFQIFTASPDPTRPLGAESPFIPPSKVTVAAVVQNIVDTVGTRGVRGARVGFAIGPLGFDHSDGDLRRLVREAFEIAVEKDVAVAFHVDDSMFWRTRKDLWSDVSNVEWTDWAGSPNRGRKLDWGGAQKLAPQMCLNSKRVTAEVTRLAKDVIGSEIRAGVERLERLGKGELFAGVIAGWETHIGRDFDSGSVLGYCGLTNRGFSARTPPADPDAERQQVVREFIGVWTRGLADAGLSPTRIYSHVAFLPRALFAHLKAHEPSRVQGTYAQVAGFTLPAAAFGESHRPGFSTYPTPGLFEEIYEALARHGSGPWASGEGTAPSMAGLTMESYLAATFGRGASLVNIFAWGIGGEALKGDPLRLATEGREAIAAYRKFLSGETLVAGPPTGLGPKLERIQKEVPAWIRRRSNPGGAEVLLQRLEGHLKGDRLQEAEAVADEILTLIGTTP